MGARTLAAVVSPTIFTIVLLWASCGLMVTPCAEGAERDRIAKVLGIREGTVVADIGAGKGEWALDLARRVGETGRVYATEIDPARLQDIAGAVAKAKLENVTVIEGTATETKLPEQCCDAILLRRVYHHFTNPHGMGRSMFASLRPGGVILVIDFEPGAISAPELPGVPGRRGGHGTPKNQLIEEMAGPGFELVRRFDLWFDPDYAMLFRRPK